MSWPLVYLMAVLAHVLAASTAYHGLQAPFVSAIVTHTQHPTLASPSPTPPSHTQQVGPAAPGPSSVSSLQFATTQRPSRSPGNSATPLPKIATNPGSHFVSFATTAISIFIHYFMNHVFFFYYYAVQRDLNSCQSTQNQLGEARLEDNVLITF